MRIRASWAVVPRTAVAVLIAMIVARAPAAEASEWRALLNHVHSSYSTDNAGWEFFKPTVAQVVEHAAQVAAANGLEGAITLTDHNTIAGCFDPGFAPVGAVQPICGEEWSGGGHAGVLDFGADVEVTPGISKEAMVAEVHARGGLVIANHPRAGSWEADRRLGVDAIEVWSVSFWDPTDELALDWWQWLLQAGEHVSAVGGSDSHFWFAPSELPTNLVLSESNAPGDMMDGVRDGHVVIVAAPAGPRVMLEANRDLDDTFESTVGDVIPVGAGGAETPVAYRVVAQGAAAGDRLVIVEGATETSLDLLVGDGVVYETTRSFGPSDRTFVRAELRQAAGGAPYCLTNPIYFVGEQAPSGTEGTIAGVIRANGAPLAGATVTAAPGEQSKTASGVDGTYGMIVPNGTYTLTVQATGYATRTVTNVVVASGTTPVDVDLSSGCGSLAATPSGSLGDGTCVVLASLGGLASRRRRGGAARASVSPARTGGREHARPLAD